MTSARSLLCFISFWCDSRCKVRTFALFYILQLVWRDSYSWLYWFRSLLLSPSSMWTGSGLEKSPPQRSAMFPLILEMKHFTPALCLFLLPRHLLLQSDPSSTFMSIAWPTKWLLRLEGVTIAPWSFLPSSFLKELVRTICKCKVVRQINSISLVDPSSVNGQIVARLSFSRLCDPWKYEMFKSKAILKKLSKWCFVSVEQVKNVSASATARVLLHEGSKGGDHQKNLAKFPCRINFTLAISNTLLTFFSSLQFLLQQITNVVCLEFTSCN